MHKFNQNFQITRLLIIHNLCRHKGWKRSSFYRKHFVSQVKKNSVSLRLLNTCYHLSLQSVTILSKIHHNLESNSSHPIFLFTWKLFSIPLVKISQMNFHICHKGVNHASTSVSGIPASFCSIFRWTHTHTHSLSLSLCRKMRVLN